MKNLKNKTNQNYFIAITQMIELIDLDFIKTDRCTLYLSTIWIYLYNYALVWAVREVMHRHDTRNKYLWIHRLISNRSIDYRNSRLNLKSEDILRVFSEIQNHWREYKSVEEMIDGMNQDSPPSRLESNYNSWNYH